MNILSVTQKKEMRITETQDTTSELNRESWAEYEDKHQDILKDVFDGKRWGYCVWKRLCPQCGKEFYTMSYFRKYCQLSCCRNQAKQDRTEKKKREHYSEHICSVCSAYFISKRTDAKFCSNACRQRAYRNKR